MANSHPNPLLSILIVVILFMTGLGLAFVVSETVDPVFEPYRSHFRSAVERGEEIEAVAIGNSHGVAIDFDELELEGARIWRNGADYHDTLVRFRSVRPNLPSLRYVFMPITPEMVDNTAVTDRQLIRVESYMVADTYWPVDPTDWKFALSARLAPVVREDNWKGVVGAVAYPLYHRLRPRVDSRTGGDSKAVLVVTSDGLKEHASKRIDYHHQLISMSRAQNPNLCEEARAALREIAEQAAPARLVLYSSPLTPAYRRLYDPDTGCQMRKYAETLASNLANVSYYDDRDISGFTNESGLFSDSDHLNKPGARWYSHILRKRLSH